MKTTKSAAIVVCLFLLSLPGQAMPILYSGTGNYYEMIVDDGISWAEADAAAVGSTFMGLLGHLATILSAGEDLFINQLVANTAGVASGSVANSEAWVGGFQDGGYVEPTGGWTWVNGEGAIPGVNSGSGYANWLSGEPNDYYGAGSENWLAVNLRGAFGWNDEGNLGGIAGYVVEYDGAARLLGEVGAIALREPGTLMLLAIGFAVIALLRRRKSA